MKYQNMNHAFISTMLVVVFLLGGVSTSSADAPKVTANNYVRAESDYQFKTYIKVYDCFGKFVHSRAAYDVNNQITVRGNRDTLYSFGVFDLMAPLTVTLPDAKGRYQSLMIISQDHSISAVYSPNEITLTRESVGSRFVMLLIRTFMNPNDKADIKAAHQLQDSVSISQSDKGVLTVPDWKKEDVEAMRSTINVVAATVSDSSKMFGIKDELDPVYHMLGAAMGWGGLPAKAALYGNVYPNKSDGKTAYTLTVKDVPVDAFWSVTLYDNEGWMPVNKQNAYSFNSVTSKKNKDGSVTIHFGGDPNADNFLPIVKGWNYIVRQYRPRKELLDGTWTFPAPVEVK